MDVREKLVELLRNRPRVKPPEGVICGTEVYSIDATVDYLIAHGVTVQELDVVEVVRCKDCVYFRPAEDWNGKKYNACYLKPNVCIFEKKMEDFCSCGERRLPQPPKGE